MEKPIKITIPGLACEYARGTQALCNPRLTDCKINLRYYGGTQNITVTATGVPTDHATEISIDIVPLREALKLMDKLIADRELELKRNHELRLKQKNTL